MAAEESDPLLPADIHREPAVDDHGFDNGSLADEAFPRDGGETTTTTTATAYEQHALSALGRGPRRGAFGSSSFSNKKSSSSTDNAAASFLPEPSALAFDGDGSNDNDDEGIRLKSDGEGLVGGESRGGDLFAPRGSEDRPSLLNDHESSDSDDGHLDLGSEGEDDTSVASPVPEETTDEDEEDANDEEKDSDALHPLTSDSNSHPKLGDDDDVHPEEKEDEDDGDHDGIESTRGDEVGAPTPPSTDSEPTEMPAPPSSPGESPSWELPDVLRETERLIRAVEDVEAVTAKQIFQSLEATFQFQMDKPTKKSVKAHMIVVLEQLQAENEEKDAADESLDDERSDEASDNGQGSGDDDESDAVPSENEDSDDEYTSQKPRRQKATSKRPRGSSNKTKKATSKGDVAPESQTKTRPSRRIKKDVRVKAMRIHAEALRKRRMEELRVRNEELQVECNEKDQKRAEEIAAKFDTNTEQLRVRRLEQRVELLTKLDEKRMTVVERERIVELEVSSSDSDEEDDDLEVTGEATLLAPLVHKPSAMSLLAMADHKVCRRQLQKKAGKRSAASPSRGMSARAALKSSLVVKRRQQSNLWLARELGYKSEKEHLKECLEEEQKKQAAMRKLEQERLKRNQLLRERMLQGVEIVVEGNAEDDEEEAELTLSDKDDGAEANPNDDDEEQAMARAMEEEKREEASADEEDESNESPSAAEGEPESPLESEEFPSMIDDDKSVDAEHDSSVALQPEESTDGSQPEAHADDEKPVSATETGRDAVDPVIAHVDFSGKDDAVSLPEVSTTDDADTASVSAEEVGEAIVEQPAKPKGPRNAAWKALLAKEAALVKKQKANKTDWVEDEADEEEDEQVAGLEDFGFAIHKKKKDDDENEDELNEDDLGNVVDDLSDNEGDEDAGEKARKAMELREEKERHQEVLRRLRDGYDGRRGGVAGGLGARGAHRFDQLVAADNREDAKRLGLLNDDELESDDEEAGSKPDGGDDEEDEGALIDKMLKDRFLHRSSVDIEEEFSDDEEDGDDEEVEKENVEDSEEKEQERLAKRFAKRARMQRLIEAHGHEEEFSRSRLIDEDTSLKIELQKMKNGLARKRTISSQTSASTSSSEPGKKQKSAAFGAGLAGGGSLAIALQASRRNNKTRTSFVRSISSGCGSHSNKDEVTTTSFQRCISLGSAVFSASNSNSGFGFSKPQMAQKASARPLPRPVGIQRSQGGATGSARAGKASSGTSLWSRAIAPSYKQP